MRKSDLLREMDTPMILGCVELNRSTLTPVRRPIRPTVPAPAPGSRWMAAMVPPDPAPASGLLKDLVSLSSGTLASLSRVGDYDRLDAIHADLIRYYLTNFDSAWVSWVDVWHAFVSGENRW